MPPDLLHLLKQIDPLDLDAVPASGPQEVLDRILASEAVEGGVAGPPRRWTRPRLGVALTLIAALLVAAAFTPPGRAIAERIAELVGIGDEPSGSAGFGSPAVVIGVGESPDGFPYEVVAARAAAKGIGEAETCVGLDLPGLAGGRVAECLTPEQLENLRANVVAPVIYAAPPGLGPEAELITQGLVRADATEVEVRIEQGGATPSVVPTQLVSLDESLGDEIGSTEEAKFFAGFIPHGVIDTSAADPATLEQELAEVEVVVRGESGEVLVEGNLARLARARGLIPLLIDPRRRPGQRMESAASQNRREASHGARP